MSDNHDLLNDKDVCSFEEHEAENVCSNKDAVACGDGLFTTSGEYVKVLCFSHFTRYMTFSQTGKKGRKKQVKNSIEVSVVLHLVTGDTSDNP